MIKLTVFTPTYNRAHTLPRTYESLVKQDCKEFIWLIVDDGSTDQTEELVRKWQTEKTGFEIRYIYKPNGGMHTAHNTAYENIDTELNVCIDSDDSMAEGAISAILNKWEEVKNEGYAGLIGLDADVYGQIIGKDIMFPPSIGLLIENPSFINNYTAFENLKTLASIRRRIDDNRIRETLTEIGLDPDDKRTFHKFSLGMKQRLGIAAAIMENPDIIILDEPINALDDTGTEQIRDILIRHRERGALIIIACHDADELNFLSDEIIEIVQGQIKPSKDDKKTA